MINHGDRHQSSLGCGTLLAAVVLFALTIVSTTPRDVRSASTPPAKGSEVRVFAAADEYSQLIETVRDGGTLAPIAESTGPGGEKWFMVKTRGGNIGWIKASDNAEVRRVDDHFRALPRDAVMIGPASAAPEAATKELTTRNPATGAITIPVKINGPRVIVPVTFTSGTSSSTGSLLVDTGATQTMISKRLASELRLYSLDTQKRTGIGGSVLVDVGQVESVKVGEAEVKNMRVSIHDRVYDLGSEGLLGFDFLGRFQMTVDTEKQVMVLTPRKK